MVDKNKSIPKKEMTKNKITAVLGPTNPGKTHLAIELSGYGILSSLSRLLS